VSGRLPPDEAGAPPILTSSQASCGPLLALAQAMWACRMYIPLCADAEPVLSLPAPCAAPHPPSAVLCLSLAPSCFPGCPVFPSCRLEQWCAVATSPYVAPRSKIRHPERSLSACLLLYIGLAVPQLPQACALLFNCCCSNSPVPCTHVPPGLIAAFKCLACPQA